MCPKFTWKKNFAPGNGGGVGCRILKNLFAEAANGGFL